MTLCVCVCLILSACIKSTYIAKGLLLLLNITARSTNRLNERKNNNAFSRCAQVYAQNVAPYIRIRPPHTYIIIYSHLWYVPLHEFSYRHTHTHTRGSGSSGNTGSLESRSPNQRPTDSICEREGGKEPQPSDYDLYAKISSTIPQHLSFI